MSVLGGTRHCQCLSARSSFSRAQISLGLATMKLQYLVRGEVKRGTSKTTTMDFRRADFGLLRTLVERDPLERVLEGRGVQVGWTFFKEEVLKTQEQAVPCAAR